MVLLTEKPLSIDELALIKESFDDSSLIVKVDIVDWAKTSDSFRKIIEKQKVVLQHASSHMTWMPYKIAELGNVITGKTPKNTASTVGEQFPFITPPDFNGQKWIHTPTRVVSAEAAKTVKNNIIPAKSVMVTCIGSDMGKVAINSEACLTNQQINSIVVDERNFSPEFIYYNLSLRQEEIKQMAGGSAQPILNKSAFSEIWISCPSLKTQESIVSLLRPLDDRIALLRETNATLEAIAQALFKSWFVDFDPVHANAGTQAPSLPPEIQALFPATFTDSPQGPIPEGWDVGAIKLACQKVESGGTPKRSVPEYWSGDISWLSSGEVRNPIVLDTKETISQLGVKESSAKLWPAGSTIVAMYGATAGEVCILAKSSTANQACCGLIPKSNTRSFVFFCIRRESENLAAKSSGSAQQNLNKGLVESHEVVLPTSQVLTAFEERIGTLFRWLDRK